MTVINFLNKKHKVSKNVIDVLVELYGQPMWLVNPKKGQDTEIILEKWANELGDYNENDLKTACYNLFRYYKCKTFPSLSHVVSVLQGDKNIQDSTQKAKYKAISIEQELLERDCKLGRPFYTIIHYQKVVSYILNNLLPETVGVAQYRQLELSSEDEAVVKGNKYRKAMDLGLFNYVDDLLLKSKQGGLR